MAICHYQVVWAAFKRCIPYAVFGVAPILVLAIAWIEARRGGVVATDFRYELYPEAKQILHGVNPFPSVRADLSFGRNTIFPVPGALLVAPLTVLNLSLAADVDSVVLLVMAVAAAWVMGVRDWRVYGLLGLWPTTVAGIESGNLTIPMTLLVALAWRYRDRRYAPGIAIGAAIALKLFLWPLLVWLLALHRFRAAAVGAALGFGGGFLLVLPFISLGDYLHLLDNLSKISGPQSYDLAGLLAQAHAVSFHTASIIADVAGLAVLVFAYARRSLALALAAALVLSPIVWNHYFFLLLVPLAVASPTLSPAWVVPLALWVCPGLGPDIRLHDVVVALLAFAAVIVLVERASPRIERPGQLSVRPTAAVPTNP